MFKRFGAKRQKSWQRQKRLRSGEGRGRLARRARRNRSLRTVTTRRVSSGFREATKEKTGRLARRARCHKRIRILKKVSKSRAVWERSDRYSPVGEKGERRTARALCNRSLHDFRGQILSSGLERSDRYSPVGEKGERRTAR